MATLALNLLPRRLALAALDAPQLCYALLTATATAANTERPLNWALVADASRSMRIPIVDEAQFRALVQQGGAQELLVDGVPVWQLGGPAPATLRATAPSALDSVTRALHTVVDRLDSADRFSLIACATEAMLLAGSLPGSQRAALVAGINRLPDLRLGDETDLAQGLALALAELRRGRDSQRAARLLLLTDGFTRNPAACRALAAQAAAEGVPISTVGLGSEFQEDLLTELADRSGGRALFLRSANDIPRAVGHELALARAVAARAVSLEVVPLGGALLRRVTRIRPELTLLWEASGPAAAQHLSLGDLVGGTSVTLLIELLAPPAPAGPLAQLNLLSDGLPAVSAELAVVRRATSEPLPAAVHAAAARASAARLQHRALAAAAAGIAGEAARLLRAAAARFDELGEAGLALAARQQAFSLESKGYLPSMATKELTYATRRLGEEVT